MDDGTTRKSWHLVGALLWCCCFQFFVAEQVVRQRWTTPYSWSGNFISDLGAVACANRPLDAAHYVCSPWHALMNASFVLQGVLIVGGVLLLSGVFPAGKTRTVALVLLAIAGVTVALVGFAPEDVRPGLHFGAAAVHFLCGNAGMIVLGMHLSRRERRAGRLSLFAGSIGFVGLALLAVLSSWRGGWERIAAYPFPLWLTAMGVYLAARTRQGKAVS